MRMSIYLTSRALWAALMMAFNAGADSHPWTLLQVRNQPTQVVSVQAEAVATELAHRMGTEVAVELVNFDSLDLVIGLAVNRTFLIAPPNFVARAVDAGWVPLMHYQPNARIGLYRQAGTDDPVVRIGARRRNPWPRRLHVRPAQTD